MKTLTGYLRETSVGTYYMDCSDGTLEYIWFKNNESNVPTNRLIVLSVGDSNHVPEDNNYRLVHEPPADEVPRKHIGIFRFIPLDSSPEKHEHYQQIVDEAAAELQDYYRYYSDDRWHVRCRGYVVEFEGYNVPPYYARNIVDEFMKNHDMEGFDPNYFHTWGGTRDRNVCGLGDVGGNRSCTYINLGCGVRTIIHELGHNFGLKHAGRLKIDGSTTEYGDKTSVMGSGQNAIEGHHSFHMMQLGWYEDREIHVIDYSQEVLIAPIEMPYHGMHPNEYQHVVVKQHDGQVVDPVRHPDLTLSLRKAKGTRYPQRLEHEQYLYPHWIVRHKKTKIEEPPMKVGDKRKFGDVKVHYLEYNEETARVDVLFDDVHTVDLPMPEGFPTPMQGADFKLIHSGAWDDINGQGLDIHTRMLNGKLQATLKWYTYTNNNSGLPVFYTATGFVENGQLIAPLYKPVEGTWDSPTTYINEKAGECQLYFLNDELGVFNYRAGPYGRGGFEITPVVLTNDLKDGIYYDKDYDGTGFDFRFYDDLITGFFYCWDNHGRQRWMTCQGKKEANVYVMTLRSFFGGRWKYYTKPEMEISGTAKLLLSDLSLKYDIDTNGIKAEGWFELEKLF